MTPSAAPPLKFLIFPLGFGLAHVWAARDLAHRSGLVLAMQATFFVGGLARIVSILVVGMPIPLFVFLGGLELVIPPLVWWWLRQDPT